MTDFRREIDFRTGVLRSELTWHTRAGGRVRVVSQRLVSLEHRHLAVLRLSLELLDAPAAVTITSQLVNRQDVAMRRDRAGAHRPAPIAHVRSARARTGAADPRRRRFAGWGHGHARLPRASAAE